MMPGKINPKQMQRMMKQMGIQNEELDAEEVIIKLRDRELVIANPQVTKVKMQGTVTFQIIGDAQERTLGIPQSDIEMVMDATSKSEDESKQALEETDGDIAEAIEKLTD
ncbi:MAG: nascent polypeptide-associated complex protein [Candidatus Diapherotrites archaeon]|nr:nascent polypeptide-associated complex protein [Candidatus Diapherotrites archaeon]